MSFDFVPLSLSLSEGLHLGQVLKGSASLNSHFLSFRNGIDLVIQETSPNDVELSENDLLISLRQVQERERERGRERERRRMTMSTSLDDEMSILSKSPYFSIW